MTAARQAPFLFPDGARLGVDNVLLHARAKRHEVRNYAGPLSIKTVLAGRVAWTVAGRDLVVDPASFLILPAGQEYSMHIDAPRPVETCCAFFAPGFVERTVFDAISPLEQSLDPAERLGPVAPYLAAVHHDAERALVGRAQSLVHRGRHSLAPSGWEEDFLLLAIELMRFSRLIREQAARIPAAKSSTRAELFRRLLIGREYMHSRLAGPVSLADVARSACLSPFHFHRAFTQAFQKTPHHYLTSLRLAQARGMLERGSRVLDACLDAGFVSPAAFTRLFRTQYGESPSAIRKFARLSKK
ncbi:MAG: AraC family transcriptional regulator [Bryobacteraceae bacterium]|nr:AraC family transcriptional regulator [Bryobacteraceae bacterium]